MARLIVTHHARRRLRERGGTPEEVKPVLSKLFTLAVRDGTRRVALTPNRPATSSASTPAGGWPRW